MEKAREKFLQEATDLIDDLEKAVLQLENSRTDHGQLEEVFRVMHTFKGTAKMFGFDLIGEFTHYLENIYDDLRAGRLDLSDEILEVSLNAVDYVRQLLHSGEAVGQSDQHHNMVETVKRLSNHVTVLSQTDKNLTTKRDGTFYLIQFKPAIDFLKDGSNPFYLIEDVSALGELHIRTYTDKFSGLDPFETDSVYLYWDILLYAHHDVKTIRNEFMFVEDQCELAIVALSEKNFIRDHGFMDFIQLHKGVLPDNIIDSYIATQSKSTKIEPLPSDNRTLSRQTIKVTYEKIDKLMSIVSELVTTQARLSLFADGTKTQELEEISENVEKLVRQLRDEAFSISLLPMRHLSMRFERLIRDTSRELDKKIRFVTVGGDTELDKKIIENLMDPMLHILRNSMDHGIESPADRIRKGKDETGTIQLKSYYSGTNVIIEIQDDGAGIDKDRVWKKALKEGLVKETDQLTDTEIFNFIFHSGFSTARQITNVSGRGVGMDVVRRSINNLRGEIEVHSQPHKGTVIRLKLPLSLSIIDGLLVDIEQSKYVIPLSAIDKCYEVESDTITPDMHDLIVLDGEQVPYISLRKIFHCTGHQPKYVNLIVARHEERKVVFEVDSIIDEYQAVIKPLGKIYKEQDFTSGATILGNGTVALVLDTHRLITKLSDN